LFKKRFELSYFLKYKKKEFLNVYQHKSFKSLVRPINIIYSQINSVNYRIIHTHRLNIIRLYLIKSYRGRCHALGKPTNGQRT